MTPETTIRYMADKIRQSLMASYGWGGDTANPFCRHCGTHDDETHDPECPVKDMESPLHLALKAAEEAQKEAA